MSSSGRKLDPVATSRYVLMVVLSIGLFITYILHCCKFIPQKGEEIRPFEYFVVL